MSSVDSQIAKPSPYPLDPQQFSLLTQAISGLSQDQLHWASGYLAGVSAGSAALSSPLSEVSASASLTILYASQTGNAQSVAQQLADSAAAHGIEARLVSTQSFKPRDLAKEKILLFVVSTQGEGEVPESAHDLWKFLNGRKAPDLSGLQFAVYGLGDSSYTLFCKAGVDFDERFAALGGKRLLDRVDADVDFDAVTEDWIPVALEKVEQLEPSKQAVVVPITAQQTVVRYGRNTPFSATLIENRQLTTDKALSDVRHLSLEIDAEAISYQPGDSIGVWFKNADDLVDQILTSQSLDGQAVIKLGKDTIALRDALLEKRELTLLNPGVVSAWAEYSDSAELKSITQDAEALREFSGQRQFIDLILDYPGTVNEQQIVDLLKPLQPRLYSIASSQQEFEDEIHLTVSALHYQSHGRAHEGAASGFLVDRSNEDDVIGIYVVENESFRLPQDGNTPIIMIGAGTGIAPFRGFLQERAARDDSGKNWLIFGNRNFHEDFLYQSEWVDHRQNGLLTKVSAAFSRDGENKVYVQDKVIEQGEEILQWLEEGACIYVCGAMDMETGVAESLKKLVMRNKGLDETSAEEFIENLRDSGRYLRDVY